MTLVGPAWGEDTNYPSIGLRGGVSTSQAEDPFWQTEFFSTWDLPWKITSSTNWILKPRLELAAGLIQGNGTEGFIGSLGPELVFGHKQFPVILVGGLSLTGLSRDKFKERDLGFPLEFTSHLGLEWTFLEHWKLGYRFQHMSNAGLGHSNPGLNMSMISLQYQF